MKTSKIIKEIPVSERGFIYRAIETDTDGRPSYGMELEYGENGTSARIELPDITADKTEILEMIGAFAEGCVFPNVFEETAYDYVKTRILKRTFAAK